jgi:hypothetical protein
MKLRLFFVSFQSFRDESSTLLNSKSNALFIKTGLIVLTLVRRCISYVLGVLIDFWVAYSRHWKFIASKKPFAFNSISVENRAIFIEFQSIKKRGGDSGSRGLESIKRGERKLALFIRTLTQEKYSLNKNRPDFKQY